MPPVLNKSLSFLTDARPETPVMERFEESSQEQLLSESQSLSFLLETQDGMSVDIPDLTQEAVTENGHYQSNEEVDFQQLLTSDEGPHGQEMDVAKEMELPWKCEECDKGFTTETELERHQDQHRAYREHQVLDTDWSIQGHVT